jgi:hypothetical protein
LTSGPAAAVRLFAQLRTYEKVADECMQFQHKDLSSATVFAWNYEASTPRVLQRPG